MAEAGASIIIPPKEFSSVAAVFDAKCKSTSCYLEL